MHLIGLFLTGYLVALIVLFTRNTFVSEKDDKMSLSMAYKVSFLSWFLVAYYAIKVGYGLFSYIKGDITGSSFWKPISTNLNDLYTLLNKFFMGDSTKDAEKSAKPE